MAKERQESNLGINIDLGTFELKTVTSRNYLRILREALHISRIYYPGCWNDDFSLEQVFDPGEIVYLDRDPETSLKQNFVLGDMAFSPFPDNSFDAVFIQDVHMLEEEFDDVVRALRPGGYVIFSTEDCGSGEGVDLFGMKRNSLFSEVKFPFKSTYYTTFQKLCLDTQSATASKITDF